MKRINLLLIILMVICTVAIILYADGGPEIAEKAGAFKTSVPTTAAGPSSAIQESARKQLSTTIAASKSEPLHATASPTTEPLVPSTIVSSHSFTEPTTGMEFLPVAGGCFQMGNNSGDSDEKPEHQVCLDGYYTGKYEVTQEQWQRIMGNRPSFFTSCGDNCPVENVSWNDVQEFIRKLNQLNGRTYRLLTEAEWEYACRSGGKAERFCGGDDIDAVAWYDENSSSKSHPVGEKKPNGLGIFDMSGNVWEWANDLFDKDYYSKASIRNPEGPTSGSKRVIRGGSWYNDLRNVRASIRGSDEPDHRSINLGFRLAFSTQ